MLGSLFPTKHRIPSDLERVLDLEADDLDDRDGPPLAWSNKNTKQEQKQTTTRTHKQKLKQKQNTNKNKTKRKQ